MRCWRARLMRPYRRPACRTASRRASISLDLSGDPLFKRLPPAATRAGEGAHVLRPDYAALVLAQVGWTALCERELTADDYENEALPTLVDASCAGGGLLLTM